VIIDLDRGYLLVSSIGPGSALGVLAGKDANLGNLAYDMAIFANRANSVLSPALIDELKKSVKE
jgi:predicted regulator of Ras-like GTPase activity (Roadblock/LC7/MglB family)